MLRPSTKGDDSENTSSTSKKFSANCYKANVDLIYAVLGLIFYTIFLRMYVSSTRDKITYGFGVIKWTFEIISGPWSRLSDNFAQGYLFLETADQMSNATRGPLVRRLVKDLLHIDRLISICNLFSWWQSIFLSCSFGTPTSLSLENWPGFTCKLSTKFNPIMSHFSKCDIKIYQYGKTTAFIKFHKSFLYMQMILFIDALGNWIQTAIWKKK